MIHHPYCTFPWQLSCPRHPNRCENLIALSPGNLGEFHYFWTLVLCPELSVSMEPYSYCSKSHIRTLVAKENFKDGWAYAAAKDTEMKI